jgi:SAM-dependent methyltransferase
MNNEAERIQAFVDYTGRLKGDEKGEAQVFCDRLFQAFGHKGYKEAGATLEERVRTKGKGTKFADLVWKPRLLLEMKKRGEKLHKHYDQAFEYWLKSTPERPRYVVLCNFDEFWIYDFDLQFDEPVDRIALEDLPRRYTAFNFLFPAEKKPQFKNNRIAVTRSAADRVARVFKSLTTQYKGRTDREGAQRFILQCVVAMFSEDVDLLPRGLFSELLKDCRNGGSAYDLLGALFHQMNNPNPARGGRFQNVRYFNGGLFDKIEAFDLTNEHINYLMLAAEEDWSKVQPAIFGTLFQHSMDEKARHAYGAHFTSEADIQKIVLPTIIRPWTERIEAATTLKELLALHKDLLAYRVLDPACGSGNFLYVAYRRLKWLEMELLELIYEKDTSRARTAVKGLPTIGTKQFYGIDTNPFAVELAKVTLMLAKELTVVETQALIDSGQIDLPLDFDNALPLDNLDSNIRCDDALFCEWPKAQAIIGNPPYQSKNKLQQELGRPYLNRLRDQYSDVPGRADFCVYWFRRAHDELSAGDRAGLVGTNTIRQNYSREGGLDYIVQHNGTITEAVSTQVWSGDAAVHVSIVNWVKGKQLGTKNLYRQLGDKIDSPWSVVELNSINSALSVGIDVTQAKRLNANMKSDVCYQGQTHGHEGFLLEPSEAAAMLRAAVKNNEVIYPYLTTDDLLGSIPPLPQRYVIDFAPRDVLAAKTYKAPIKRIQEQVLPAREMAAEAEEILNKLALEDNAKGRVNHHHRNFLNNWWQLSYARGKLIKKIATIPRYIACGRVTKRPIFEFIDSEIRPSDSLQVFPVSDDYSFGILQSGLHWLWFTEKCSTLKGDWRYTSDSVFDTFAWPQKPTLAQVKRVADAAVELRLLRSKVMVENGWTLRELYRTLDLPGANPIKKAQDSLDNAVRAAYGMRAQDDPLKFLLDLNSELHAIEEAGKGIISPGLPPIVTNITAFITEDCVRMPD